MKNNSLKKWYQVLIEPYIKQSQKSLESFKYSRELSIVLMLAMFVLAGLWGYRWWNRQRQETAQKAFSECMFAYQQAFGQDQNWSEVAMLFNIGYDQHKGSSLAPYFLAFYADALLRDGQREQAIEKLEEAIKALPTDSPLISLYKTKQALVELDDENPELRDKGLNTLKLLAAQEENKNRDMVMYYLGLYQWLQDNIKEAQEQWQLLIDTFKDKNIGVSPWASLAREKLEQIP